MIRDLLRRLLRPPAAAAPAPVAPRPPPEHGPVDAAALRWWQEQNVEVACVDLRPRSALRYGFVEGAVLLPPGRPELIPAAEVVVFVGEGAPEGALWTADLSPWEAAGVALRAPEWKAPLPLLHPIRTADGRDGWIQDIAWAGDRFVFAVLLADGQRLEGLDEEDLASRGPRGAAGLGEQI